MNNRQQKEYEKINKFLNQFGAKIKDGENYVHSELPLTIVNKYNIERVLRGDNIKRLSKKIDFWTFDGEMCDRQKSYLDLLRTIAESKGGKIISTKFIDCDKKITCMDKDGNVFDRVAKEIKDGAWSPYESKRVFNDPDYHFKEIQKIVELKGGKLISTKYISNKDKLELMDKLGNIFFMSSMDLKRNHWSPYESQTIRDPEYHLQELKEIAKSKGGKLISTEYIKAHSKLEFEDKLGNRFFITPTDVKSGKWSGYECGRVYAPEYHLKELKKIAESKGGKLISTEYINAATKMEFEDRLGNRFFSIPNSIKRGQWSPFEKVNISEEITRQCMEFIFKKEFLSVWGVIKSSVTNKKLQYDGYNEELKIAFEYQGEQHYYWKVCRDKTEEKKKSSFKKIQINDKEKLILSKEKNITLIHIKYFNFKNRNVKDLDYILHVISELSKYKIQIVDEAINRVKNHLQNFSFVFNKIPTNEKYLEKLRILAKEKGGKLISTNYINSKTKVEFEDRLGNRFWRKPVELISMNRWSPYEGKNPKSPNKNICGSK